MSTVFKVSLLLLTNLVVFLLDPLSSLSIWRSFWLKNLDLYFITTFWIITNFNSLVYISHRLRLATIRIIILRFTQTSATFKEQIILRAMKDRCANNLTRLHLLLDPSLFAWWISLTTASGWVLFGDWLSTARLLYPPDHISCTVARREGSMPRASLCIRCRLWTLLCVSARLDITAYYASCSVKITWGPASVACILIAAVVRVEVMMRIHLVKGHLPIVILKLFFHFFKFKYC